jgi:hypothetical protein
MLTRLPRSILAYSKDLPVCIGRPTDFEPCRPFWHWTGILLLVCGILLFGGLVALFLRQRRKEQKRVINDLRLREHQLAIDRDERRKSEWGAQNQVGTDLTEAEIAARIRNALKPKVDS